MDEITYSFKFPSSEAVENVKALAAELQIEMPESLAYQFTGLLTALGDEQKHESINEEAWLVSSLKLTEAKGREAFPEIEEIYLKGISHGINAV